ncbi:MAG: hypothetical protein F6K42_31055 [Leptolyngbya sp. SIO1D8]|nr:hypothetical protein [Leptolyngbya sp. SIO1D8]
MKSLLIQLLVLPRGLVVLGVLCSLSLMLLSLPSKSLADNSQGDEFPDQRQGGGTHWIM